jgi:RNA polymerase sigma factor (sigma-70 family)
VRVLVNTRRDQWRKAAVRNRHVEDTRRSIVPAANAEAAMVARAAVWSALDALSSRRRAVIVMHELDELGVKDIATLLGISSITVRWHLSRGRRELARILAPQTGE